MIVRVKVIRCHCAPGAWPCECETVIESYSHANLAAANIGPEILRYMRDAEAVERASRDASPVAVAHRALTRGR